MKYALIGCGRISINHIKAAIDNNLIIVAICDVVEERMDFLFEKFQLPKSIKKYTCFEEMLSENKDLDLVSIATDSGSHAKIAKYCIGHGINTIIEKPMAMCMKDANDIIELSIKMKVKVSVCHQNRFNIVVQNMMKQVDNGKFGHISHGSINVRWNRDESYYSQADWRGKWATDGGALMNQCIHGIDLLLWAMNDEVVEVYGQTRRRFHHYLETEDLGVALLKFKNGSIGIVEGTVNVYPKNLEETLCLFGEKGTCILGGKSCNNIEVWEFFDKSPDDVKFRNLQEKVDNIYGNGHIKLFANMIDCIKNDSIPLVDANAGKKAVELILAIYQSQKTGSSIKFPLSDTVSSIDFVGLFD